MAVLVESSDVIDGLYHSETPRDGGALYAQVFTVAVPEELSIAGTIRLARLPQHAVLLPVLSWIRCLPATVALTVSLGWEAYTDMETGLTVAAAPTGLGTTLTIAAGTPVLFSAFPAAPIPRTFKGPAVITCLTAGAAIAAAGVVSGCIVYANHY